MCADRSLISFYHAAANSATSAYPGNSPAIEPRQNRAERVRGKETDGIDRCGQPKQSIAKSTGVLARRWIIRRTSFRPQAWRQIEHVQKAHPDQDSRNRECPVLVPRQRH